MVTTPSQFGLLVSALLVGALGAGSARAEPASNRVLSGHQVMIKGSCVLLKVNFNLRIRYAGHVPIERGTDLRIRVQPIDPAQAASEILTRRESLRPPDSRQAPVRTIEFEATRIDEHVLNIQFLHPVVFQVGPGADFQSIVVAIGDAKSQKACKPEFPTPTLGAWDTRVSRTEAFLPRGHEDASPRPGSSASPGKPVERAAGKISDAELKSAAASMDEARAAIRKGEYGTAITLLRKVLHYPENQYSADAQELLGVAYQKDKQPSEAKAQYEDYLARYPSREGAESVRQRLAAIQTAEMPPAERLRVARKQAQSGPGESTWSVSGSSSGFYVRDDSFHILRDPTLAPNLNADKEDRRVHQNAFLSSFDLFAAWGNNEVKSKFRISATEEHRFNSSDSEITSVAALYLETMVRDLDTMLRIGRQTRNTGGVLGRFDGALVSWQANPWMKLNVVGGSPVLSRRDEPFKDDKFFYGASLDFGPLFGGVEASLFAIEQRDRSLIDRQAVGTELRYLDPSKSAFFTLDYDTHFQELNAAIFSASLTLPDKSIVNAGADYRKTPYLTSWNALQGQQYVSLYDLLRQHTLQEIQQMALDRTATYKSATIGYSYPLAEKLQLNLDATAANISGTPASFGVDGLPSLGDEFYYSAQLIGTNLLLDGDLYTAAVRYAQRQDSDTYALDLSTRYPFTEKLRATPHLLFSYRNGKLTDLKEYSVLPSVLFNYLWTKDLNFELELGTKWTTRQEALGVRSQETELFVTAGFRYDFYADGKGNCPLGSISCK